MINGLFLDNKVLAVTGRLDMHGLPVGLPWTKLAATAMPGDRAIEAAAGAVLLREYLTIISSGEWCKITSAPTYCSRLLSLVSL